jgi:PAS domain S-box-containing protein
LDELLRAQQRQRFLLNLTDRLRDLIDPLRVMAAVAEAVGRYLGVGRCGYGEVDDSGQYFTVERDWTDGAMQSLAGRLRLDDFGPALLAELRLGRAVRLDDRAADPAPAAMGDVRAVLVMPLVRDGRLVAAFYVHQRPARRWTDEEVALVADVAERTRAAVERARAETALRISRAELEWQAQFLDATLSAIGDYIYVWNREQRFVYANKNIRTLWGIAGDRHLGKTLAELGYSPELCVQLGGQIGRVFETGKPETGEAFYESPTGVAGWYEYILNPVVGADGHVGLVAGISRDTTERRRTEDKLRVSAARRQALLELGDRLRDLQSPADISYQAAEILGRTLGASRAGYGAIDRIAETLSVEREWTAPAIASFAGLHRFCDYGSLIDDLKRSLTVVIADTASDPRTAGAIPADEAVGMRSLVNVPITERGRLVAILYVHQATVRVWQPEELDFIREVAERTRMAVERSRAEHEVQALTVSLERLVEERTAERDRVWQNSRDLIVIVGADGIFRGISPSWRNILGHDPSDVIGRSFVDFVWSDDAVAARHGLDTALADRDLTNFETRFTHRDGTPRAISWHTATEGNLVYAFGRDVTEERRRQAELAAVQEALRQSQKLEAMGQLIGGVAHDFNNLLTPIVGSLDLLQNRRVGDDRTRWLIDGALRSAERAQALVQRLLTFARRQPLSFAAVDVAEVVNEMTALLTSTAGPQIDLAVDIASPLPPANADVNQLEMALLNLAVNARDAMPEGGTLTIRVKVERVGAGHRAELPPGIYVLIAVIDTGVGMDETTLRRATEPFFSTKGVGRGTGLGLSMVHGLAAQLGGALTLASKPGKGTTVELWLPVAAAAAEALPRGGDIEPIDGGGTVLLIDDEELVRAATAGMLADLGYVVIEASNADEARRLLQDGLHIDLLVTDHLMPGMTGTDFARELRSRDAAIPVLVITGYADGDRIGPDFPRLTKPFRHAELSERVAELTGAGLASRH